MSVFSGPVQKERVYPLIETGEYIATLYDLTFETGGTYGDSLLWKWYLALPSTPTDYLCRDDGNEKIHHEYTSPDIVMGSKSHEWIAALTGKALEDGDEPPDAEDLIGKRMVVYVTHQAPKQGPNVGKLRERFVAGSSKRWGGLPGKGVAKSSPTRPSQAVEITPDQERRAVLMEKLDRLVSKAVKLETPRSGEYRGLDMAEADNDQLEQLAVTIQNEINEALDA